MWQPSCWLCHVTHFSILRMTDLNMQMWHDCHMSLQISHDCCMFSRWATICCWSLVLRLRTKETTDVWLGIERERLYQSQQLWSSLVRQSLGPVKAHDTWHMTHDTWHMTHDTCTQWSPLTKLTWHSVWLTTYVHAYIRMCVHTVEYTVCTYSRIYCVYIQ